MIEGRCMRCRKKKVMKDVKIVKNSIGRFLARGVCIYCGCNMCKIVSKANAETTVIMKEAVKGY